MRVDPALVDRIYEAAVVPERWPKVLQSIADEFGAKAVTFIAHAPDDIRWVASEQATRWVEEFMELGWAARNDSAMPLITELYPGFRTLTDYWSLEELDEIPVQREFFRPRGLIGSAATIIQGAGNYAIQITMDGFGSHEAAKNEVGKLDALRPHVARALSLSAQVAAARTEAITDGLALAGVDAAIIGRDRHLRSANRGFLKRFGDRIAEGRMGLRFANTFLDARFTDALAALREGTQVQSISVPTQPSSVPFVIHLLPIVGTARELLGSDGVMMIVAEAANASIPNADLLRLLFDLTPAEAVLTRRLLEGLTVAEAARVGGTAENTARVQLRTVFAKTGTKRQVELMQLLAGMGPPEKR